MIRPAFLLLASIASLGCMAQQDTIKRSDADGREFLQITVNGVVHEEGYTINGRTDGIWTTYYPWGYPKTITSYKNGKKNGMHIQTTERGNAAFLENYQNDLLEGPRRVYNAYAREVE